MSCKDITLIYVFLFSFLMYCCCKMTQMCMLNCAKHFHLELLNFHHFISFYLFCLFSSVSVDTLHAKEEQKKNHKFSSGSLISLFLLYSIHDGGWSRSHLPFSICKTHTSLLTNIFVSPLV